MTTPTPLDVFIRCSCGAEMIQVTRWPDDPETYLSFWYYGEQGGKLRWRHRLKVIWKILREGRGHPDHLVLDPAQVSDFVAALVGTLVPDPAVDSLEGVGPIDTAAYRAAVETKGDGIDYPFGSLPYTWQDKPHRLVWDLCAEVDRLRAKISDSQSEDLS